VHCRGWSNQLYHKTCQTMKQSVILAFPIVTMSINFSQILCWWNVGFLTLLLMLASLLLLFHLCSNHCIKSYPRGKWASRLFTTHCQYLYQKNIFWGKRLVWPLCPWGHGLNPAHDIWFILKRSPGIIAGVREFMLLAGSEPSFWERPNTNGEP